MLLVTIAGGNAVAIRYISCDTCELEPFFGAAMRFGLASIIFAVIAVAVRARIPHGPAMRGAALYGVLQFGAGFGLVYLGLVHAPAGLAQVLLACVPLLTFGLALAQGQERFRWRALLGATLAIAGIAVVFNSGVGGGVPLTSMVAILAAAVCWAEALVVVKGSPQVHAAVMNAIAMGIGTVILAGARRAHR